MFSCLSFVLGGVMALSCMKYLHSVSDIFLWEPGGFLDNNFTDPSLSMWRTLTWGKKTTSALGTSSFGGQKSIQK